MDVDKLKKEPRRKFPQDNSLCQLENPPFYQCCCMCRAQVPYAEDNNTTEFGGYACLAFAPQEYGGVVITRKTKHSCGCELFDDRRRQ